MDTLLNQLDVPFTFHKRPTPLPGDLRTTWRIALLLLILFHSRAQKASLQKLHVLNWAARTEASRGLLLRFMSGSAGKDEIVPRIEPSLNRAIDFARGEGLVIVENGKNLKLTDKGVSAAREIGSTGDCLAPEKAFLQQMKSFVSERRIEDLITWDLTL